MSNFRLVPPSCGGVGGLPAPLPTLLLRTSNGTLAPASPVSPLRVVTLSTALPLLLGHGASDAADGHGDGTTTPSGAPPVPSSSTSLQRVVADYARANSPVNASRMRAAAGLGERLPFARGPGCAPPACAKSAGAVGAWADAGVSPRTAVAVHEATSFAAPPLLLLALAAAAAFGVRTRRRARERAAEAPPLLRPQSAAYARYGTGGAAVGADAGAAAQAAAEAAAPPEPPWGRAAGAVAADPEREPLTTGSMRLVSIDQLGH